MGKIESLNFAEKKNDIVINIMAHCCLFMPICISLHVTVFASFVNGYTFGDCLVDRTKFVCFTKTMTKFPKNFPPNLNDIQISHTNIRDIQSDVFQNLKDLETLVLAYNKISHVDKGVFKDLVSLKKLNLNGNRLTILKNEMFHGLSNLKVLLLENNSISTIENFTFSLFYQLQCLKLSGNKLGDVKRLQTIFNLETLKELHIGRNNISVFQSIDISESVLRLRVLNLSSNPLNIFKMHAEIFPYLEVIDMSWCFTEVPFVWEAPNIFFQNIRTLHLVGVKISAEKINTIMDTFNKTLSHIILIAVPAANSIINSICQIPTLTEFDMRRNSFNNLNGTGLESCRRVKILNLKYNRLANLENDLVSLERLISLELAYNEFKRIPKVVQKFSLLENLSLAYNEIEEITCHSFSNLINLKSLSLYGNRIFRIDACIFQSLTNLKILKLGTNNIGSVNRAFKHGPAGLENLEIGFNSLTTLNQDDFSGLRSLRHLFLNDNKITTIHASAFLKLVTLRGLYLQGNKIMDNSLKPEVFKGLTNLSALNLQNNHILRTKTFLRSPFTGLKFLEVLSVYSQRHYGIHMFLPSNMLSKLTMLRSFWAQDLGLKSLPSDLFKDNHLLKDLHLSGNYFSSISPELFLPLWNLCELYLTDTRLKSLDFLMLANLTTLSLLQIQDNQITSINSMTVKSLPKLKLLEMQGNTFTCDCSNAWLIKWIKEDNLTQVFKANTFECNSPPNLKSAKFMKVDMHACSIDIEFNCYIFTATLVLLTLTIPLIYHLLHWQIVYAYYLLLAFLYDKKRDGGKLPGFTYDAFISYNKHDELWVTNELVPKLEGEQGWRLCLHHRDFQPGKPIVDNIVDGIYGSRKTICIISRHYLESEWCSREVQVASFRLFDEKKDVLILVFLEDIPVNHLSPFHRMRSLVKRKTFLSWPKAGQDTHVFWEKLRLALYQRGDGDREAAHCEAQIIL